MLSFEIKKVFKRMPIKSLFSIILLIFAALVFNDWRQQQNQTTFIQEQLALYHETFQRWLQQKPAADRPIYQRNLTRVEQLQKSTNTQQPTAFMNAYYNYFIDPTKLQAFWVPFLGESSDNGEFYTLLKANELNDTYSEISWLKKKHVTPIFPQTVLTNPETLANFNGSQATMQTFKKPELFIRGLISAYRTILDQFSCCYGVVKPRCTVFAKGYQIMGLDKFLILNFEHTCPLAEPTFFDLLHQFSPTVALGFELTVDKTNPDRRGGGLILDKVAGRWSPAYPLL